MRLLLLTCVVFYSSTAVAQDSFWSGMWHLNDNLSSAPSATFSIRVEADGENHVDDGTHRYSYKCDGKSYPTFADFSVRCRNVSPTLQFGTTFKGGQVWSERRREVSTDGQRLTITAWPPNHPDKQKSALYRRTTAGTGFSGSWLDTQAQEHRQHKMLIRLQSGMFHLEFPDQKQFTDSPLTGSDAPTQGLKNIHASIAVQPNGNRQMFVRMKQDGVLIRVGMLTLSPDGEQLSEDVWRPSTPSAKTRLVFDKQR